MNGVGGWGDQEPGSTGGHLSTVGRPCGPFSGPNRHGQSPGTSLSGEGVLLATEGGAWEARLELPLPPPPASHPPMRSTLTPQPPSAAQPQRASHSQRKRRAARASGEARASRPPLHGAAAPSRRLPFSDEQGPGPGGTYQHLRPEPPKTTIQQGGRPRVTCAEGPSRAREAGGGAAATRQRVPGQCAAPALQAALGETLVCRVGCGEESNEGTARRPAASVHRVQGFQAPGTAPTAHPETRANGGSPGLRGLSRDSALPSRALRRLELGPRRDAGFACSLLAAPGTGEAARGRGMSGRMRVGAQPERRAFGRRSVRGGGSGLARLRRCLGRRGCGGCGLGAEGELGAAELFAATGFTNASHTGAGSWDSAPLGRVQLWHQNLGIRYQRAGVQRCTCPGMEAMASLLGHTIS